MAMFDVGVHVRALFRAVTTVGALKARRLAALVLEVAPQGVLLLVNFTAVFAGVAARLDRLDHDSLVQLQQLAARLGLQLLLVVVPAVLRGGGAPLRGCKHSQREKLNYVFEVRDWTAHELARDFFTELNEFVGLLFLFFICFCFRLCTRIIGICKTELEWHADQARTTVTCVSARRGNGIVSIGTSFFRFLSVV